MTTPLPSRLSAADFRYLQTTLAARSGQVVEDGKEYLAEFRLTPLARRLGLESAAALVGRMRAGEDARLAQQVIEAMTVNETSFFRDGHPFVALREHILPGFVARRADARRLAVWSAACSTGQEPYSVAMLIRDHFPVLAGWDVQIGGSDLSADMLGRARAGRYTQVEVSRGLTPDLLARYFTRLGDEWELIETVRRMVQFRPINLLVGGPPAGSLDVLLLRNVLIYFDPPTRRAVLTRARTWLRPDGVLLLGSTETIREADSGFRAASYGPTVYYQPAGG